jgi:hypothetical protein
LTELEAVPVDNLSMKTSSSTLALLIILLSFVSCGAGGSFDQPDTAEQRTTTTGAENSAVSVNLSKVTVSSPSFSDGVTPTEVTIQLINELGNPVVGRTVDVQVTGNHNTWVPCSKTNSQGIARCKLYSTAAENKEIRLLTPVSISQSVTFVEPNSTQLLSDIVSATTFEAQTTHQQLIANAGNYHDQIIVNDNYNTAVAEFSLLGSIIKGYIP